jgi:hypothetical protein
MSRPTAVSGGLALHKRSTSAGVRAVTGAGTANDVECTSASFDVAVVNID